MYFEKPNFTNWTVEERHYGNEERVRYQFGVSQETGELIPIFKHETKLVTEPGTKVEITVAENGFMIKTKNNKFHVCSDRYDMEKLLIRALSLVKTQKMDIEEYELDELEEMTITMNEEYLKQQVLSEATPE